MFPSIVRAYHSAQGRLDADPYTAWSLAVRRLRSDWEDAGPVSVGQLADYLQGIPHQQHGDALQDLIAEHMRLAWQAGRGELLDAYLAEFGHRFAQLASTVEVPADLVEDEFLARYARPCGDTPRLGEYQRRFPSRPDVMELLHRRCLDKGRYVKLDKCGQGAMGEVFQAYDHRLQRLVAVKQPREDLADNADLLRRFAEEARVTAELEHTAIVSVHEHYQDDDTPFYVMRLASGQTLSDYIRDYYQPPTPRSRGQQRVFWDQLLQAFAMICDAIAYAHAHGVLHRDLKSGNIVVGQFGEIAILDWGMAKRLPWNLWGATAPAAAPSADTNGTYHAPGDDLSAAMVAGTPQYMSPEQANGYSDQRSDVFGLGAILYEILVSHPPHAWPDGFRPADWQRIVAAASFPSPRRLNPKAPRALAAVCMKALAPAPLDRYQNAADLAEDVRCYLSGEPVTACGEPILAWARRRLCR